MKKFLPFILPGIALLLVIFLAYRWYDQRTQERLNVPEVSAGTEIEELSASELAALENLRKGVGDFKIAKLKGDLGLGEVRYEIKDGKVLLSIIANLATDKGEVYQLWLKENQATEFTKSKVLNENKGGLIASVAVAIDKLPIAIEIRKADLVVLRGEIQAEQNLPLDNQVN